MSNEHPPLVLRRVEVDDRIVDVGVADGRIDTVAPQVRPTTDAVVIEGHGGALVPGLHDHHLHLLATAAAAASTHVGPPQVRDRPGLVGALRSADASLGPGRWLRAVGYHDSVAGDLDRHTLDDIVARRPVRVQHRSGARWTLNTVALDRLDIASLPHPGIERDPAGRPTGRLHRADHWLGERLPPGAAPDLGTLGRYLASLGVIGVTDTTPSTRLSSLGLIADAVAAGALPQRVMVTGGPELIGARLTDDVEVGPVKLVIDDGDYPALDALAAQIDRAHRHGRAVAIHSVTRASLVLALAGWDVAGSRAGDRLEHGSVIPIELVGELARRAVTVVTQPGFVAERGDEYRREVDAEDLPHLYRCRSLLGAGVPIAGSTDAPYTDPDPWRAMRAAVSRSTPSGIALGADEAVSARQALGLFLGDRHDPGGPPRTVGPGEPADLCLLDRPLTAALEHLTSECVATTVCAGRLVHHRVG